MDYRFWSAFSSAMLTGLFIGWATKNMDAGIGAFLALGTFIIIGESIVSAVKEQKNK